MVYFEVATRKAGDNSVTVFDAASNDESGRGTGSSGNEIVAVPVLPVNPTVQPNVSPANLISR
jgi:hypothetical protein